MELDAPQKLNAKSDLFKTSFWNKYAIPALTGIYDTKKWVKLD